MRPTLILAAALAAASAPLYAQSCREADAGLAAGYSEMQANGNYGGQAWSESRDRRLDAAEKRFSAKLAAYLARPASWGCAFPKLRAAGVETAAAADGKIRAFSWDRQNGGTMHNEETLLQYRSGGKTALRTGSGGAVRGITAARLPPYGTVYFVHYRFRASSRLYTDRTELLHIAKGRLKPLNIIRTSRLGNSLAYEADIAAEPRLPAGRENDRIAYDAATRTVSLPVVVAEKESDGDGRITAARIRYRFDGRYFVLQR
ncbi:Uncharacterised protein [Kingella potus]|uniref:Uncharacterized protein n=1 Tax=Kingella potus TaxID=265175 RepID=A0A377R0W9_9NEIS|nr:hypothetical protein [Kingella potus]STQ99971.1 Uncharacterised protein [Kingella potus]